MTRDELWESYVAKNPSFASGGNVTLSAAGLRKMFNQTWDKANAAGFDAGVIWGQDHNPPKRSPDIFDKIFNPK